MTGIGLQGGLRYLTRIVNPDGSYTLRIIDGRANSTQTIQIPTLPPGSNAPNDILPNGDWTRFIVKYSGNIYDQQTGDNYPMIAVYDRSGKRLYFDAGNNLPTFFTSYHWIDDNTIALDGGQPQTPLPSVQFNPSGLPQCLVDTFPNDWQSFLLLWQSFLVNRQPDQLDSFAQALCAGLTGQGGHSVNTMQGTPAIPANATAVAQFFTPTPTLAYLSARTPAPVGVPGVPACITDYYQEQAVVFANLWRKITANVTDPQQLAQINQMVCSGLLDDLSEVQPTPTINPNGLAVTTPTPQPSAPVTTGGDQVAYDEMAIDISTGARTMRYDLVPTPAVAQPDPLALVSNLFTKQYKFQPSDPVLSPDGRYLAAHDQNGFVDIYQLARPVPTLIAQQATAAATQTGTPVHSIGLAPAFHAFVDQHTPTTMHSLADWLRAYQAANLPALATTPPDLSITSGAYRWDGYDPDGDARLLPSDGQSAALERIAIPADPTSALKSFIAGSSNVLLNVSLDQRADLHTLVSGNQRDFRIAEIPGRVSLVILLNFATPTRPLPGFHPVSGQPLDQGKNPFFSDLNVRRALQLAIDQKALIGSALQRSALPLSSLFAPTSWAFDSTLPALQSNLEQARQLLDKAGWIDNGSVRVCRGCGAAKDGTTLQFTLSAPGAYGDLINRIAEEWTQLGVSVGVNAQAANALADQTFDAYLQPIGGNPYEDADPDRTLMLTPPGDVPGLAPTDHTLDDGSYSNPQVTALLAQARTLPGCDPTARAALYHQLDRLLQSDLPFLYVAAPDEFYAAASNVIGFAPRAGDPLWNVESWVVAS